MIATLPHAIGKRRQQRKVGDRFNQYIVRLNPALSYRYDRRVRNLLSRRSRVLQGKAFVGDVVTPYELHYGEREKPLSMKVVSEVREFADTRQPLHRVVLRDLKPDTSYAFTIQEQGKSERL